MTDFSIRFFANDDAIKAAGEGLLALTLPRPQWTHEAHLAACLWLVRTRSDILLETELPDIIRAYNESVGGINDDTQGYHETLTQFYIATVRVHQRETQASSLCDAVNMLLASARGRRDWPLRFYSRDLLFCVAARRKFIDPDLLPLSAIAEIR